jgi:hypothetical protein
VVNGIKAGRDSMIFQSSKRGLATPVSTLIIFVSLTLTASFLYYLATIRVEAWRGDFKFTAAEEKMLDLGSSIDSVAWAVSSSEVLSFSDYRGSLSVEPEARRLILDVTIGPSTYMLLNTTTGRAVYEMPSTKENMEGTYLRGDDRTVVNRSTSITSQIYFIPGEDAQDLVVAYRPLVSSSIGGLVDGKRINNIRVYLINLNASEALSLSGEFFLGISCVEVSSSLYTYNTSTVSSISVTATLAGDQDSVFVPIENGSGGAQIRVEVMICSVRLAGVGL